MEYTINQRFISKNRSYKPLNAKGTVLHETATPGASDEDEFRYFDREPRGASAHAFVDYDSITQTIPWNEQAWHAGTTANNNYIGIELCNYNDAAKFNEIWKRAVWLFAYIHINIIKVNTITKDTLMSHAEVSNKWRESDHQDPVAYFRSFGRTVDEFRNEVQQKINSMLNNDEGEIKVKNLVVYGNNIDKRAAEYLADYLQCATIDGNIPYDYSNVENVYCVGAAPGSTWTSYADNVIQGSDRYETMKEVLKFMGKL